MPKSPVDIINSIRREIYQIRGGSIHLHKLELVFSKLDYEEATTLLKVLKETQEEFEDRGKQKVR